MNIVEVHNIENELAASCFEVMKYIQSNMEIVCDDGGKINEQNYMISFAYLLGVRLGDSSDLHGGELKKNILCDNENVQELLSRIRSNSSNNNLPNVTVKPDFVIHSSIGCQNLNENTQKLVIEAKTATQLIQDNFSWDLFKLGAYINQLSFKVGIFLIVNEDKSKVDDKLKGYIRQGLPSITIPETRSLFFFLQKDSVSEPEAYQLI